jgi:hypothetical protein
LCNGSASILLNLSSSNHSDDFTCTILFLLNFIGSDNDILQLICSGVFLKTVFLLPKDEACGGDKAHRERDNFLAHCFVFFHFTELTMSFLEKENHN